MSTQCRHFVQNAWKKELCSNCFKSREEHATNQESHRQIVTRTTNSVKRVAHKVQGILRLKDSSSPNPVRSKRKNVAFPESLTEIIGYDGGDDCGSDYEYDDPNQADDPDSGCGDDDGIDVSLGSDIDDLPDSEEERALGNLTRANTNFNTITANLTGTVQPNDVKSFATLMLGRAPKDGETKKKPLLVTVTPFGGDDSVPTARRPSDKKSPEQTKPKPSAELTLKPEAEPVAKKPAEESKPSEQPPTAKTTTTIINNNNNNNNNNNSSLGKIVDMPLITSTNLLSVIETKSMTSNEQKQRATSIARTPAIKKPENEKPRIAVTQQIIDQNTTKNHKNLEMSNGVELNLSPMRNGEDIVRETSTFGKEIKNYKSTDYSKKSGGIADLTERKVEGEAASEKYPFEESRESAGEPDGKADEEVIAEPPALPKSPPPIESSSSSFVLEKQQQRYSTIAEPRSSFLHGITESKTISKPLIPQKPVTLPSKAVGASLASLLSENRAYEFRLSQAARKNNLVHSQSETQLCDDIVKKRKAEQENQNGKVIAESCSELFKASVAKVGDKEDTTEEDEDEDDSETSSTDQLRSNSNKRRMAPQPPASSSNASMEDSSSTMFARNPAPTFVKSDCPVVREKEKRERAASCSPKFRKSGVCDAPDPSQQMITSRPPEPAPRRNISLSQDSLAIAAGAEKTVEEKKKTRSKFSLKKFLRMGTRKDVDMTGGSNSKNDEIPCTPQPKPRLEIIHPLELDGAAVQVLRKDKTNGEDTTDSKSEPSSNSNNLSVHGTQHVTTRPSKPPPPPRSQSLDESSRPTSRVSAPKQAQQASSPTNSSNGKPSTGKSWQPSGGSGSSASDSIYANLVAAAAAAGPAAAEDVAGAMRSGLAPAKPRRTSSMRDQMNNNSSNGTCSAGNGSVSAASGAQTATGRMGGTTSGDGNGVTLQRHPGVDRQRPVVVDSKVSNEHRSCSPELNDSSTSLELRQSSGGYTNTNHPISKRQSDSSALESNNVEMKFHQSLYTRSTSLPYCASEVENEMYSPFAYYYEDKNAQDGQVRENDDETRIGRLRQRRGRSIVHRSLEDNYSAVIVANHEALAQFLEQMNKAIPIPVGLRSLKTTSNLQLNQFNIDRSSAIATSRRIFFSAAWNDQNVTLCVAFDPSMHASRKEFYLVPIVEFIDTVPKGISDLGQFGSKKSFEATISVLPRLQVNLLKSFSKLVSPSETGGGKDENSYRESSFVLLQLVSALKSLQARGIEEAPGNLANIILCREDKDVHHRLYMFQRLSIENCEDNEEEYASLCQCAQNGLTELNLAEKLPLVRELLMREKAVTLSQVKSILEFSLWGPSDATLGGPREREQALQRWLDLERATILHALVRARAQLTVADEYQLLFLVRTSAKIMCEASLLLDRQRNGLLQL